MSKNSNIRDRILIVAKMKFYKFGFKKTTMDEIAYDTGISKTTLYEYFKGKDKLLEDVLEIKNRETKIFLNKIYKYIISDDNLDVVKVLKELSTFISNHFFDISPILQDDIQKFSPKIHEGNKKIIEDILIVYKEILNKGVENDIIRNDVNIQVVIQLLFNVSKYIVNDTFAMHNYNYSKSEAIETSNKILIEGLLTEKGLETYKTLLKNTLEKTIQS